MVNPRTILHIHWVTPVPSHRQHDLLRRWQRHGRGFRQRRHRGRHDGPATKRGAVRMFEGKVAKAGTCVYIYKHVCLYVCMYIYIYMYFIYIDIYIYVHIHVHILLPLCICTHIHIHAHILFCICTYSTYTYTYAYAHTHYPHTHTCTYTIYIYKIHTYTYVKIRLCIHKIHILSFTSYPSIYLPICRFVLRAPGSL